MYCFPLESDINFSMKGIIAFCSSEEKTPSKILVNIPANVAKVSSLTVEDCEVYDYTICFLKALEKQKFQQSRLRIL